MKNDLKQAFAIFLKGNRLALSIRLGSFLVSIFLYIAAFGLLFPLMGVKVLVLSACPVAAAGWFFGRGVGFLAALLLHALNVQLLIWRGFFEAGWESYFENGALMSWMMLAFVGWGAGMLRQFQSRYLLEAVHRQQREARFRVMIENSADGISLISPEGIMLEKSPAVRHILGYAPEELIGDNFIELVHPDDRAEAQKLFERVLAEAGGHVAAKVRIRHKDGSWRWIDATGTNCLYEPSIAAIVVNYRDVTEQIALNQALQRRISFDQALLRFSKQLELVQSYQDILHAIQNELATTLDFHHSWLYLARQDGDIEFIASAEDILEAVRAQFPALQVEGDIYLEEVWQREEIFIIPDAQNDPRVNAEIAARLKNRTLISVPIRLPGKFLGFFGTGTFGDEGVRHLNDEQLAFLTAAAGHLAAAISRLQLQQELEHRLRFTLSLTSITQSALETLDLPSLLQKLVNELADLFRADSCFLTFWDEPNRLPIPVAAAGPYKDTYQNIRPQKGEATLTEAVLEAGRAMYIEDTRSSSLLSPSLAARFPHVAALGLPLIAGEEKLGAVILAYDQPPKFPPSEIALAEQAAAQIALAISKTKLIETERHQREEADNLRQLALTFVETFDLDEMLQSILSQVEKVIPYDSAHINLIDENRLKIVAYRGLPATISGDIVLDINQLPHVKKAFELQHPIIIPDTHQDPHWVRLPGVEQIRCWLGVPLVVKDRAIGMLNFDKNEPHFYGEDHAALSTTFASQAAVAIENARLFAETLQRQFELASLLNVTQAVSSSLDLNKVLQQVALSLTHLLALDWASISIYDPVSHSLRTEVEYSKEGEFLIEELGKRYNLADFPATADALSRNIPLIVRRDDPYADAQEKKLLEHFGEACVLLLPLSIAGRTVGLAELYTGDELRQFQRDEIRLAQALADQAAIAISNAQLYAETRRRLAELEAVNRLSIALRQAQKVVEMPPLLLQETAAILNFGAGAVWLYNPDDGKLHQEAALGWFSQIQEAEVLPGTGIAGHVFRSGEKHLAVEFVSDPLTREANRKQIPPDWGGVCVPLRAGNESIGVFFISVQLPRVLTDDEIHLLEILADIAGNALRRAQLHEQTTRQVHRLVALRTIDEAITSSLDLQLTLNLLLENLLTELEVDAACVLLLNTQSNLLEIAAWRGFRTTALPEFRLVLNDGMAGRVAMERTPITIPDLKSDPLFQRSDFFVQKEGFVFYTGVPLIAKGQVKGILEVYRRTPFLATTDWLDFLDALVAQAAIAIDSAQLFADLERSHAEITLAYDYTLEGWVQMLDLRDKETEGHTQRVTEMTLRLARMIGLSENELVHIRRGALLHDIGKLAVPDRILLKTGPLLPEEWDTMRLHPLHAYNMLARIPFLRPALDIPYCHHEKWDGTGYPRGLKGAEIPLTARIFAVVDVWDAVTSDRPYRKAWTPDQARSYLIEQKGQHFDPNIVDAFLQMLDADESARSNL